MLILLTHVHRKNFGIYGRLHLFQNIVTGLTNRYSIDKPCLKTKQYVNTVTNCLCSNSSFNLCLCFCLNLIKHSYHKFTYKLDKKLISLHSKLYFFDSICQNRNKMCQYRNIFIVTVLTVTVLIYSTYFFTQNNDYSLKHRNKSDFLFRNFIWSRC